MQVVTSGPRAKHSALIGRHCAGDGEVGDSAEHGKSLGGNIKVGGG